MRLMRGRAGAGEAAGAARATPGAARAAPGAGRAAVGAGRAAVGVRRAGVGATWAVALAAAVAAATAGCSVFRQWTDAMRPGGTPATAAADGAAAPGGGTGATAAGAAAAPASGPRPEAERVERLANGLRVIVRERRLGGVAAFRIYLPAGSLNEGEYAGSGISHLLEHVVSGGSTATRSEDDIRKALDALGAQVNAHTSKQYVCYHAQASADRIEPLIDLVADCVMNCQVAEKEFQREFEVVQRELERAQASPDHRLWMLADETVFLDHPARNPILGYPDALRQLRHEDLVRFYRRVAAPDNAVAVAVGDFDADAVLEKIRRTMSPWPRRAGAPVVLPPRAAQLAPRRAEAAMDVAGVRMLIEFASVQLTHPDLYPLDLLAFVLGEGRSSRLVADLRDRRGLVQTITCFSYTPAGYDGGRFAVLFQAEPAKAEAARQAVLEHLARAVREAPSADELARAKRQKISEHVFALQECEHVAADLGTSALLLGDPHFSDRYVRSIQDVRAEDVRRAAAAYLRPEAMTVTAVRPRPAAAAAGAPAPPTARRPEVIQRTLKNGVRLLLCPIEGHPTVSIQMVARAGLSVETEQTAGTSYLMARLLVKGTARRSAADIARALDALGAEMTASAGRNTLYLSARCLAEDFEKTFDLAADSFLHPAFPDAEVDLARTQALGELARLADTPHGEASLYFHRVFFTDSPYRFPVQGTADVVKALGRGHLVDWHREHVSANNVVVAVFGGVDALRGARAVVDAFAALPANPNLSFPRDVPPRKTPAREVHVKPSEKGAAVVYVAYPGMDIYNIRDRFALELLDTAVSGYQMPGGWLHEQLRGRGLVYEVHAFPLQGLLPGYFTAMAVCQPAKVPEVVRIIEAAMRRATRENFTDEQLAVARAGVITAKELSRETVDAWAFEAAVDEALGLGCAFAREEIEHLRRVRPEDVLRVAREYLKHPVIAVVTSDAPAAEAVRAAPTE